ncbi:MAG TPA: SAM-dependent methyltransferase [Candidatus Limnocylindrales bacterium]|nr:SAM-dependent methyltransferase [Candidatus Limnocylindrales bacterium]
MDLTPGLRRAPAPTPSDAPTLSDTDLEARIRDEIHRDGPMTFARFMELALYDPEHGYYRRPSSVTVARREGDFLTAPEMHPLFGATLARPVAESWRACGRPTEFTIVEYGAGTGALAAALLDGIREDEPALAATVTYVPIEIGEPRLAELRDRLTTAGHAHTLRDGPMPTTGIAIANEYLDALPVHIVERSAEELVELRVVVGSDDALALLPTEPSTPGLARRLEDEGVALAEGQRAEICLGLDAWADDLSSRLDTGAILVIDYGVLAADLYGPSRPAGTLMAYAGHRAHDDPLVGIGRQDLTAHVDFTAVRAALEARGWRPLGITTQAELLVASGMETVLVRYRELATDVETLLALRSAAARLLDPRATGGFRVLGAARGVTMDLGAALRAG